MRRLSPIKVQDAIESLAEHAIETNLAPDEVTNQFKKRYLEILLDMKKGNQCAVSRLLGIHRNTMTRQIRILRINPTKGRTRKHREAKIA